MKTLTIGELRKIKCEEFEKLFVNKIEEFEKSFNREKYFLEEKTEILELMKLKIEEFSYFLKNEKIESWNEFNNFLEDKFIELLKIYELYLLASENHLRGVETVKKCYKKKSNNSINY